MNYIKILFLLFVFTVTGCSSDQLSFVIRYTDINGLSENDFIIHKEAVIGTVGEIQKIGPNKYDVQVLIDQNIIPVITQSADFVITEHPMETGEHVINLLSQNLDDVPVEPGQVLMGATQIEGMVNTLKRSLNEQWQLMSEKVDDVINQIDGSTIEQEIAPIESELDRLVDDINVLSTKAKRKLKEDILPNIKEKIERIKSEIEAIGDDQPIERIEEKLEHLERTIEA